MSDIFDAFDKAFEHQADDGVTAVVLINGLSIDLAFRNDHDYAGGMRNDPPATISSGKAGWWVQTTALLGDGSIGAVQYQFDYGGVRYVFCVAWSNPAIGKNQCLVVPSPSTAVSWEDVRKSMDAGDWNSSTTADGLPPLLGIIGVGGSPLCVFYTGRRFW